MRKQKKFGSQGPSALQRMALVPIVMTEAREMSLSSLLDGTLKREHEGHKGEKGRSRSPHMLCDLLFYLRDLGVRPSKVILARFRYTAHMTVIVNGEPRECPDGASLAQFIEHMQLKGDRVAVELNREIPTRIRWATTP